MAARGRESRGPALVYCALSAALVVMIASIAFTARQPPPPQIAELTPQAQHQITRAPSQLASNAGSSPGGACVGAGPCGPGSGQLGAVTTTTRPGTPAPPALPPVPAASVHHCFGNPPRQIQDTQSPPCVAYWQGDNGGQTSTGVTGSTIRVLANPIGGDPNAGRVEGDLQTFFNRYFEFYGRELHLIPVNDSGGVDCATGTSEADGAYQAYKPFAATTINNTGEVCISTELARDHVVEATFTRSMSEATMRSYAPYLWEYPMSEDAELASTGRFVCAQLAGHDASYSPDPQLKSQPRRFGLILEYLSTPYAYSTSPLTTQLARCGVTLAASKVYQYPDGSAQAESDTAQFSASAVVAMKNAGVTTVLCFCSHDDAMEASIPSAAESQDYHPEWLLAWSNDSDGTVDEFWSEKDEQQGLMGMTALPDQVPYPDMTLNWALAAVDPGFQINQSLDTAYQLFYWELLLIASGIQMAGPDLTPATFQAGLQGAHFPNPFSPEQEGVAGFLGGVHSMTGDYAVMWWSATAASPYPDEGLGAWCYVDGGERFGLANSWATPMALFSGPCYSSPAGT